MRKWYITALALIFISIGPLSSQNSFYVVKSGVFSQYPSIKEFVSDGDIITLSTSSLENFCSRNANEQSNGILHLNNEIFGTCTTQKKSIIDERFRLSFQDHGAVESRFLSESNSYRGILDGDNEKQFAVTIGQNSAVGLFLIDGEQFYLEPLKNFVPNAENDKYVLYNVKNVIVNSKYSGCAATHTKEEFEVALQQRTNTIEPTCALELELAIVSDYSMYSHKGSIQNTQMFAQAVMNNVQLLYDNEFKDGIQFKIVSHYIATSSSDPLEVSLTSTTNPIVLIQNFRFWANEYGIGNVPFDLGQLWTRRDLDGSVIGMAFRDGIGKETKYHLLQDYTGNTAGYHLSVLATHEIGHNLGALHDPITSMTIMRPVIANLNVWSDLSKQFIQPNLEKYDVLRPLDNRIVLTSKLMRAYPLDHNQNYNSNSNKNFYKVEIPIKFYRNFHTPITKATLSPMDMPGVIEGRDYKMINSTFHFIPGAQDQNGAFNILVAEHMFNGRNKLSFKLDNTQTCSNPYVTIFLGTVSTEFFGDEGSDPLLDTGTEGNTDIICYPNPITSDWCIVSGFKNDLIQNVEIIAANGTRWNKAEIEYSVYDALKLNLRDFSPGVYFIKIQTNNTRITKKIIKTR
ncbi:MAG: T9SS type A sorting domain-containing protein [Saprospiraceae bacterium]|nr:T9SS type A sorting domain-containing protein [Saprospiraceae bacterium]